MQACESANNWMLAKYDAVNAPALKRLISRGTELRPFPLPVIDAAYDAAKVVYAEYAAQSPLFAKGLESVNAYLGDVMPWWKIGEYSYDTINIRQRERG